MTEVGGSSSVGAIVGGAIVTDGIVTDAIGGTVADGAVSGGAVFGGIVVHGDKRGRQLGFPTANISVTEGFEIPADGVYACWVSFPPETARHGATVSIGDNPTFDDVTDRRIEAFVHDLNADLYGRSVLVTIAARLRSMVRCDTLDELILRTKEDVERSRALLAGAVA